MKRKLTIETLNPIWSQISPRGITAASELLFYKAESWYTKKRFKFKQCNQYRVNLVSRRGVFLTGYASRLQKELSSLDYSVKLIENTDEDYVKPVIPELEGIKFRPDQMDAFNSLLKAGRGLWQAPTGSGKTLLIAGLINAYYSMTALVLVHTETLFKQTHEELSRWFGVVGKFGAGVKNVEPVTVGMIQTISKLTPNELDDFALQWGMVIVDEAHHIDFGNKVSKPTMYEKFLCATYAPIRFGFTATLPDMFTRRGLAAEGLLGPVIGETTYNELQDAEILAKPKLKMVYVPATMEQSLKGVKGGYAKIYEEGIVKNRKRNELIIREAQQLIQKGLTVLIMVERLEHGEQLLKMAESWMPGMFTFLHGSTDKQLRNDQEIAFKAGERRGVIATRIWTEGINIRSLGAVVNAAGGESEIAALQKFGRGLRRTELKTEVYLVDFFDSNHWWFVRHSGKRVCLYFEMGWL